MKMRVRFVFMSLLFFLTQTQSHGQNVEISVARTLLPGMYAGIRYVHPSASALNLAGSVFVENARPGLFRYNSVGLSIGSEYCSSRAPEERRFGFKILLATCFQLESEPWVFKDWPLRRRINYGVAGELGALWHMSDALALSAFLQQRLLFNKILGSTYFLTGLSLSYRLGL